MATLTSASSTQHTNAFVSQPSVKNKAAEDGGRLRRKYASYSLSASDELGTGAVVSMFRMPKGATIASSVLTSDDLGGTTTLLVGWNGGTNSKETADPNGIYDAIDVSGQAYDSRSPGNAAGTQQESTANDKTMADEVTIEITNTVATTAASSRTIQLEIWYAVD